MLGLVGNSVEGSECIANYFHFNCNRYFEHRLHLIEKDPELRFLASLNFGCGIFSGGVA